ncbi:hypothetical protein GCM10017673_29120 [Streptosporangium violaceochromogenes]|nr:hypothetical protein GCM10017673_29120 [Streptosporangium violaceochromogenes]
MAIRQADTDFEQGLAVALGQFVENGSPGGIGKGLEDIAHEEMIGKSSLACQCGALLDPVDAPWRRTPCRVHGRPLPSPFARPAVGHPSPWGIRPGTAGPAVSRPCLAWEGASRDDPRVQWGSGAAA